MKTADNGIGRATARLGGLASAFIAVAAATAPPAAAQDDRAARIETIERQIQQLQREVQKLKRDDAATQTAGSTGTAATGTAARSDAAPAPATRGLAEENREAVKQVQAQAKETQAAVEENDFRLGDLETVVGRIDRQVGSRAVVNAFDAVQLDFGGFLDLAATHVNGESDSVTSFNRIVAELLVRAKLEDNWDLFWAQSFLRKTDPDFTDPERPSFDNLNSVATDTVLAWANYRYTDSLQFQGGRFITPHGIVNIEHFPATLLDPDQPQFLRPFSGQTIFPNFTDGLQVHGKKFLGDGLDADEIAYRVYTGNFAGNATEFNVGGRLEYNVGGSGLTVGVNATYGDRSGDVDADYFVYGGDLRYDAGPILWKNEIFATEEERGGNRFAAYTQPAWRFTDDWTGFYRFDYLEAGNDPVTLADLQTSVEHSLGVSYQPNANVRLRGILRQTDFDTDDDAQTVELSATLSY